MNILYTKNQEKSIAYNKFVTTNEKDTYIIFHHGLMSNMKGKKSMYIENYCKKQNYNFIRFDNFGHGESSGKLTEQNISSWVEGLDIVIDNLTGDAKVILIGSSMGGWVTMLNAIKRDSSKKIMGIIGLSPALDFTKELVWDKLTKSQQNTLKEQKICELKSTNPECAELYPISYDLITNGKEHLLLQDTIKITCPVHLIHGMQDIDVPHTISERTMEKITSNRAVLKLIKDADHRLSREEDFHIICNSIEEIISN
ncbi:alpha/beta hydrolase [Rickettsiaceae bacterium]|nr:alpha/beta hydrolase [Rickettsiaceae bacterium]